MVVKEILIHTLTEGGEMPLANSTTAANGSEKETERGEASHLTVAEQGHWTRKRPQN